MKTANVDTVYLVTLEKISIFLDSANHRKQYVFSNNVAVREFGAQIAKEYKNFEVVSPRSDNILFHGFNGNGIEVICYYSQMRLHHNGAGAVF